MQTKKYLVSTLLASGLLLGAFVTTPAAAQTKTLEPLGGWSLSKVDRTSLGGNSYCTLSRKYDDGIILSLARNTAEEYSLAVDFQKDVFSKDEPLKINLQPGPGKARSYDMLPASTKAVVVRLGWDKGFFETLNSSQKMNVTIADKDYGFSMPLIAKGQADLEDCMEELKLASRPGPAAVIPSKDVLNAAPSQASKSFDAGRMAAQTELAKVDIEEQEKQIVKNFAASMQEQEAQKNGKKLNFNQKSSDNGLTSQGLDIAASAKLVAPVAAPFEPIQIVAGAQQSPSKENLVSGAVDDGRAKALEKQLDAASAEIKALKQSASSSASDAGKMAALQKQLDEMVSENEALEKQLSEPQKTLPQDAAKIAELESKVSALTQENTEAKKKLAAPIVQTSLPQDVATIASLQKQLASIQTENSDLKEKIAMPTVITSLPDDTAKIASLEKQLASLAAEKADAVAKITSLQAAASPSDATNDKTSELEKRIAALTAENNALKLASIPVDEAAKSKIAELETKNQALQSRLDAVALESAQRPDAAQVADLQNQVKELLIKNKQLEETVRASQTRIAEAAINTETKSLKTIADLEIKLEAAQKDNITLSKEIETIKSGQDMARLSLASGNWDLEQATKRFNESERENRRLSLALEQTKMSCNAEKSKIEQMLFDPAVADQKQIDRLTQLEQELKETKAKLAAGQSGVAPTAAIATANSDWEAEKAKLMARIAALESDGKFTGITALPDSAGQNDVRITEAQKQNDQLRSELEKLRAQLADANSNGSIRADRVAMAQREAERLKQENEFKTNQALTYQNQIAALQQENNRLKSQGTTAEVKAAAAIPPPISKPALKSVSNSDGAAAAIQPSAGATPSKMFDISNIRLLLQKAGVSAGSVQKVSSGMKGAENYRWSGQNGVSGVSSVAQIGSASQFDNMVDQYIDSQKSSCGGDFASMPTPSTAFGKGKVALYETACVSDSKGISSSTLFFMDQGRFVAISSEAAPEDMDNAMDTRDRIVSALADM